MPLSVLRTDCDGLAPEENELEAVTGTDFPRTIPSLLAFDTVSATTSTGKRGLTTLCARIEARAWLLLWDRYRVQCFSQSLLHVTPYAALYFNIWGEYLIEGATRHIAGHSLG